MATMNIVLRMSQQGAGGVASALGGVAKIASGMVIGQGLLALPGLLSDAASAAVDDQAATLRLGQSLKNLGGDVGANTKLINDRIAAGQKLAFSDDQIRDSFQFLAAATGDANEALSRQKIAMDLARGAGIPLEQASKLVGKVTEENVQAFKRMGITIKEGATEQEALAAIQAKFAGQADAYANSSKGQMESASIAFDEMKETLGGAILPLVGKLGALVAANMPTIESFVTALGDGLASAVDLVLRGFDSLQPILATVADTFSAFGRYLGAVLEDGDYLNDWLSDLPGPLKLAAEYVGVLTSTVQKLGEGDVLGAVDNLGKGFSDLGPKILTAVQEGLGSLGEWIVTTGAPTLAASLSSWALQFVEWVGNALPPLLQRLGDLITGVLDSIGTGSNDMRESIAAQWVTAFADWVEEKALPALVANLPKIAVAIVTFIGRVMLSLGPALLRLAIQFADAVEHQFVPAAKEAFTRWVNETLAPELEHQFRLLLAHLDVWWQGTAIPTMRRFGESLIQGLITGMNNLGSSLRNAATNLAQSALDAIRDAIQPGSPSKVTTPWGESMADGLVLGLKRRIPDANAAGQDVAQAALAPIRAAAIEIARFTGTESWLSRATPPAMTNPKAAPGGGHSGGATSGGVGPGGTIYHGADDWYWDPNIGGYRGKNPNQGGVYRPVPGEPQWGKDRYGTAGGGVIVHGTVNILARGTAYEELTALSAMVR